MKSLKFSLVLLALLAAPFVAETQTIDTVAGRITAISGVPARQLPLVVPWSVAVDSRGYIYIGDDGSRTIRVIDPSSGIATVVAGGGTIQDDLIPIDARTASISSDGMTVDSQNNVYFADSVNNRVRKLSPNGTITTVAGTGEPGWSGDGGPAVQAAFDSPTAVALDAAGNLYISDSLNSRIRKVDTAGTVTTIAGGDQAIDTRDGIPAVNAKLGDPRGMAIDANGNIYFADHDQSVVRMITPATGIIQTVAGTMNSRGDSGDNGPATRAELLSPIGVAVAANGDLFIAQVGALRKVSAATGTITTVMGDGAFPLADGKPAIDVGIPSSIGYIFLRGNTLYTPLSGDHLVGRLELTTGVFNIIAGNPATVGDGGPAISAALAQPTRISLDSAGNLIVADTFHHRIRKISPGSGGTGTGTITTIAGTGQSEATASQGPATQTAVVFPSAVFADSDGSVYISDNDTRVQRIDRNGNIQTIAGGLIPGDGGDDGPASAALLNQPQGITKDAAGNLYIADTWNHRVRRIDSGGTITTVAGTGVPGYSGDFGLATNAQLWAPSDVAIDSAGRLLIADRYNQAIRRVDLFTGIIVPVAGYGYGFDGGPALLAYLDDPVTIVAARNGDIYIGDRHTVRWIDATTTFIDTLAGASWQSGLWGDGELAWFALLDDVEGLALDAAGNLLVSDSVNNRIRKILPAPPASPDLALWPCYGDALSFSVIQNSGDAPTGCVAVFTTNVMRVTWSATVSTTSGGDWLKIQPDAGLTLFNFIWVDVDYSKLSPGKYSGSITVSGVGATNSPQTVPVTLEVKPATTTPRIELDQAWMGFISVAGFESPTDQTLTIKNIGGGTLTWSLAATTEGGGNWLSVTPASGSGNANPVRVSVNAASLAPAIYVGHIVCTNATTGGYAETTVVVLVLPPTGSLALSQQGVSFQANEGASFVLPSTVEIINEGQAALNWTATTPAIVGGDWLKVSPSSGSVAPGSSQTLTVSAASGSLRTGIYDALIAVRSPNAWNAPQFISTRLTVQPADADPVSQIRPGGLVLFAAAGGQTVEDSFKIYSSGGSKSLTYVVSANSMDGSPWIAVSPAAGSIRSSSDAATVTVKVNPATLLPGVYKGRVTISLTPGTAQTVNVTAIVRLASAGARGQRRPMADSRVFDAACNASQNIVQDSLPDGFKVMPSQSTGLIVRVFDSCGNKITTSTVFVTFNNGDDPLTLSPVNNEIYSGTWHTSKQGKVAITFRSVASGLPDGKLTVEGTVAPLGSLGLGLPSVTRNSVVSAAGYQKYVPLAPGQLFALSGSSLGVDLTGMAAKSTPLPIKLNDVTATIGNYSVPLHFANGNQLYGQIPPETPAGQKLPLVVTVNGKHSDVETVTIANVQPGIFTTGTPDPATGLMPGIVTDASARPLSAGNPAHAGDSIVIYCTGLGVTNPAVKAGDASPNPPAAAKEAVSVFIGGTKVTPAFAGLTPGMVALYQVNAQIPAGAAKGDAVHVWLEQGGVKSNIVTIPIK